MKKTIEINIHLTPKELAEILCGMYSDEQAQVLDEIYEIAKNWQGGMGNQLYDIVENVRDGRKLMVEFGDYAR